MRVSPHTAQAPQRPVRDRPGCPYNWTSFAILACRHQLWPTRGGGAQTGGRTTSISHLLSPFKVFSIRSRKEAPVGRGLTFVPGNVETRIRPITGRPRFFRPPKPALQQFPLRFACPCGRRYEVTTFR